MLRGIAAIVLFASAPAWAQTESGLVQAKGLVDEVRRAGALVLEKLKASHPDQAERLRKALVLLNEETVTEKLDAALAELRRQNPANAAETSAQVAASLDRILKLLEEARVPGTSRLEQVAAGLKRAIAAEGKLIEGLRDGSKSPADQKENRELTEQLRGRLEEEQLGNAAREAARAAEKMRETEKGGDGAAEAKRSLERALEEVEREIEERRRAAERERLTRMQDELKRVLAEQLKINEATGRYEGIRAASGRLTRAQSVELSQVGAAQASLAGICGELERGSVQDGAAAFAFALKSVGQDMEDSAQALRDAETGASTARLQEGIARKLRDLIDAFDLRLKAASKRGGANGGSGGDGAAKRIPDYVELLLVKRMQEEILRRTRAFRPAPGEDLSESDRTVLKRLSGEQGELARLLEAFIEKLR